MAMPILPEPQSKLVTDRKSNIMDSTDYKMTFTPVDNPHRNLITPDSWNNVQEFASWWVASGMPIVFPHNTEVFLSDDATATCLFDNFGLYTVTTENKDLRYVMTQSGNDDMISNIHIKRK
jgi:hypothetical protein